MDGCIVIKDDVSAIRFFEAGGVAFVTTKYKYRGNMSTTPTTFSYKLRDRYIEILQEIVSIIYSISYWRF